MRREAVHGRWPVHPDVRPACRGAVAVEFSGWPGLPFTEIVDAATQMMVRTGAVFRPAPGRCPHISVAYTPDGAEAGRRGHPQGRAGSHRAAASWGRIRGPAAPGGAVPRRRAHHMEPDRRSASGGDATAQAQIREQRGRRRSGPRPSPLLLRQPITSAALTAPVERPAPRPTVNAEPGSAEPGRREGDGDQELVLAELAGGSAFLHGPEDRSSRHPSEAQCLVTLQQIGSS